MLKKKLAILSNVTVDLIKMKLSGEYDVYLPEGFGAWISEVLNSNSGLYKQGVDAVVVLLDGTVARSWKDETEAQEVVQLWKEGINALSDLMSDIPVFISTVDFRINRIKALAERQYRTALQDDWYQFIQKTAEQSDHIYVFDLADRIADIGRNHFYSDKMWYMSNMPYSREGIALVCNEILAVIDSAFSPRKKLIALDLDNTLWGGVAGEDGLENIELSDHLAGQRFYDFQRQLLEMQKRGVLLTLVSKNNPEDVRMIFQEHPYMLLKENLFVAPKINWNEKAKNLHEIESELNLGGSSFVFVDDNPAEREQVRAGCPDVLVAEFPSDTAELSDFAERLYFKEIRPLRILGEDLCKTEMYQRESQRRQEAYESPSFETYLKKLEMTVDIHRMRNSEIDRVVQLCLKTNQFNVTTKRYSREDIGRISTCAENAVYVAYLKDKYGESGLVSVVILVAEDDQMKIDTFLMSCRVMGRKLEDVIMNELLIQYRPFQYSFTATFIPTFKNAPVADLYDRLGFRLCREHDGIKEYEILLEEYQSRDFSFYNDIQFEKQEEPNHA